MNGSLQFRPCRLIAMAVCIDAQMVVFLSDSSMQSTERGRKLNAAVVQTGKYVVQTGKAVGEFRTCVHF